MLPLTFSDKADYDKIKPDDLMTLNDLANLSPGRVSNDFFIIEVQYSYIFQNYILTVYKLYTYPIKYKNSSISADYCYPKAF